MSICEKSLKDYYLYGLKFCYDIKIFQRNRLGQFCASDIEEHQISVDDNHLIVNPYGKEFRYDLNDYDIMFYTTYAFQRDPSCYNYSDPEDMFLVDKTMFGHLFFIGKNDYISIHFTIG